MFLWLRIIGIFDCEDYLFYGRVLGVEFLFFFFGKDGI